MEEDDSKHNLHQLSFPFHDDFQQFHIVDDSSEVLRNLEKMRREQEETTTSTEAMLSSSTSVLKSVREQRFISQSSSSSSSFTMATTGVKEMLADEENKEKFSAMEMSACPTGKSMLHAQPKQHQVSNVLSSMEAMKRIKTLSFLHNEDLLQSNMRPISIDDKSLQPLNPLPSSSLYRSISFQERRQYQHQASIKRVESGKELKSVGADASSFRKVTILSPKHSLEELNERIRRIQSQFLFHGSSENSL